MIATMPAMASPPITARRRLALFCCAMRTAAARAAAFSRWRWRLSLGTAGTVVAGRYGRVFGLVRDTTAGTLLRCPSSSRSSEAPRSPIPSASAPWPTTSPGPAGAGDEVVVVVSAMGKETDELLHLADQVSATRPGREMDMLITAGERKAIALLCMALHDIGVPRRRRSPAARPASSPTPPTPTPRSSRCASTASARRSPPAGCPSWAGPRACRPTTTSPSSAGAARTRRRWRWPGALGAESSASSTPTCRGCSPPIRGSCPSARRLATGQLRRDARDVRERLPEAGDARRSSSPAPTACASTSVRASRGSRARWIHQEDDDRWSRPSSRRSSHDTAEAKVTVTRRARPSRRGRLGCSAPWPTATSTST